jgi:hypothetical protein
MQVAAHAATRAGIAAGAALGVTLAGAAPTWPEVPPPPRAEVVEWVARDAVVNGLPTRIERFETELTPNEVLAFYRQRWGGAAAGSPRETQSGDWRALSTLMPGGYQIAVQVKPRKPSGTEGLISVAAFRETRRDPVPTALPRFGDTRVAQVTESTDGPQRSQLVSMVSTESFEVNMARWRGEWQRRGWQLAFEQQPPVGSDGVRTWLASFAKPPQSVDVALAWKPADRRSYITANLLGPAEGGEP